MENQNLNQNDVNIQRLVSGMTPMPELARPERRAVAKFYAHMFAALARTNMLRGMSLGQSWYNAIEQMKSFARTRGANNPVARELNNLIQSHNKRLSKLMMTHPQRDTVVSVPPEQCAEIQARIAKQLKMGQDGLNQMVAKYQPVANRGSNTIVGNAPNAVGAIAPRGTPANQTANKFQTMQQPVFASMLALMFRNQHTRAA